VSFNDNGTVSYGIQRSYKFLRERSSGDLNTDVIITTNMILLGGSTMAFKFSPIAALGLATLAKAINSKPIVNMTIHDYLFGYEDTISTLGSKILPSLMAFEKFGFFDQFIKTEQNHIVTSTLKEVFEKSSTKSETQIKEPKYTEKAHDNPNDKLDVEYEDSESSADHDLEILGKIDVTKTPNVTKLQAFSISLWNGSPLLPNWKNPSKNKFVK
jgi:hypothetical protein